MANVEKLKVGPFQADDVRQLEMPVELIPRNAVRDIEQVVGRFSRIQMVSGELVLDHHLADPTNISGDLAFVVGDNQVLVAFPAGDLMSSLRILKAGDLVDILVSVEQQVRVINTGGGALIGGEDELVSELLTFDAMQQVSIQAVIVEVVEGESSSPASATVVMNASGTPVPTPTPAAGPPNSPSP